MLGQKIIELLQKLKTTGFFSVFVSSVFSKVITFLGGMVLVRVMSKNDYGMYTYVMNSYGILFILSDFGFCKAMFQYTSENYKDKKKVNDYFTFSYKMGMFFSGVSSVLIFMSPIFYPYKYEKVAELTRMLALLPFISTTNVFLTTNLRMKMQNTRYALVNFFETVVHYGIVVPLSFFWNTNGAVMANYLIALTTFFFAIVISRDYLKYDWKRDAILKIEKGNIFKYAIGSQLNSSIAAMFQLIDIFFIGLFIANTEAISSYKVATTIPAAMMFVPNSIFIYVIPYFARHNRDKEWVRKKYTFLLLSCILINGLLALIMSLGSSILIPFIYGDQYNDAVTCSIILIIAFFFSGSFHTPSANIIYTQHKVRVNVIITIVTNVINCLLDIVLILRYGSIGAAIATLLVSIISGVLSAGYMINWIKDEKVSDC